MTLLPCPFCGYELDPDESDHLYPSGVGWRDDLHSGRSYHPGREVPPEQRCWQVVCSQHMGGCGAEMHGDSKQEAVDRWNRRVTHVGDSQFESWYQEYDPINKGNKQRLRDAYAAGMGDPAARGAEEHTSQPRPMCRDCADYGPICPNSGKPCGSGLLTDDQIDRMTSHLYYKGMPVDRDYRILLFREAESVYHIKGRK